jgi:hypothetical protein
MWRDEKKLSGEAVPAAGFTKRGLPAWPAPKLCSIMLASPVAPTSDRKER